MPPTKAPGRKIRAGSKRAFRRSITTWPGRRRATGRLPDRAPSSTVQARGDERLARASRPARPGPRRARRPARTARARRARRRCAPRRRRGSRSAGRSGGRRPSARRRRRRCSARAARPTARRRPRRPRRPPARSRVARARSAAVLPPKRTSSRPAPSCPGDVEAVGLQRPAGELERPRASSASGSSVRAVHGRRLRRAAGAGARDTVAISPSVPNEPANSFARS